MYLIVLELCKYRSVGNRLQTHILICYLKSVHLRLQCIVYSVVYKSNLTTEHNITRNKLLVVLECYVDWYKSSLSISLLSRRELLQRAIK